MIIGKSKSFFEIAKNFFKPSIKNSYITRPRNLGIINPSELRLAPDMNYALQASDKELRALKNVLSQNPDKIGATKRDYYYLVDLISQNVQKSVEAHPGNLRPEFVQNAGKIHKWAEIFSTQHYENGKNIYSKFYDEQIFNKAIDEYVQFVENMTGKKVLIGCKSRMNFDICALGMLNNPKAYKDVDYIILGHGKNSSLITDTANPNTWRFSDNDKSIWEFIEQNVPKGKRAMVFCCETKGLEKAGKTAAEMVDKSGVQMSGIGNTVSGLFRHENPVKICESGIRHIIGHVEGNATMTRIGEVPTQGFGTFSMFSVTEPKTVLYNI